MNFVEIKTSELIGSALDYAVAVCEDNVPTNIYGNLISEFIHKYSTDWESGGPIIEREITKLFRNVGGTWTAQIKREIPIPEQDRGTSLATTYIDWCNVAGPTPLVAAMRCYVACKLGNVVKIPQELLE